ncbi:MAG: hydrogenase maturation protease [Thermoflexales bacterium]|nr:hydrogenase maturation protease [Thermoflexales bacterium]
MRSLVREIAAATRGRTGTVLVIGYGSTLHSDDSVGPRIAEAIAGRGYPGVWAQALPQLVPELAEPLARSRAAIFVDAALNPPRPHRPQRVFGLLRLQPSYIHHGGSLHTSDPRALLALAQALYGHCPPAWLLTVPGENFALGETLSAQAALGMTQAVAFLDRMLGARRREKSMPERRVSSTQSLE